EPFEEDETAVTPPPPRHRGARISVRPLTPMAVSTQTLVDALAAGSSLFLLLPTIPAYDQTPLAMSSDNVQSAVTYTSISSDSDGPSRVFHL
nr:hypothetical protein [Tanacetum cinerariifolium]